MIFCYSRPNGRRQQELFQTVMNFDRLLYKEVCETHGLKNKQKNPLTLRSALELVYLCSWAAGSSLALRWNTACLRSSLRKEKGWATKLSQQKGPPVPAALPMEMVPTPIIPLNQMPGLHWKRGSLRYYQNALLSHNLGTFFGQTHGKQPCLREISRKQVTRNCLKSFLLDKHPSELARFQSLGNRNFLLSLDTICLSSTRARHCNRCFEYVISNKHNNFQVGVINPLYRWRIWGSEKAQITQLINEVRRQTQLRGKVSLSNLMIWS